jgi:electron transport complex protein RnfC
MMRALGTEHAIVAIETAMAETRVAVHDALKAAGDDRLGMAVVTAKYPAGGERQLIELVTGDEVPSGGLPRDIGYVCQNAGTAAAVADLFRKGRPLISRIVTVTGRGIAHPGNFETRIGTPVHELIALAGGYSGNPRRLLMGGPMMGFALPDDSLPVTKATNCIVAALAEEIAPQRAELPCIRCGECVQVCPARLMPQELFVAAQRRDFARLDEFGLPDCIECGCCDYVCPSQIALTRRFVAAKGAARERGRQQGERQP